MKTIRQLLDNKPLKVAAIAPNATVFEALQTMAERDIGALLVMERERLVGILSERDYARKVILQNKSSREIPVSEIMSDKVVAVTLNETVEQCMAVMTEKRIRHLPVLDGVNVLGVLSIGDLVKEVISEQEFIIKQMSEYIMS
jgi:CBS domain-containing protein